MVTGLASLGAVLLVTASSAAEELDADMAPEPPAEARVQATQSANHSRGALLVSQAQSEAKPGSTDAQAPIEVTVRSQASELKRLQRSADAVNVVDLRLAQQQTADLGEVLARTQGVAVRRDGGLGSTARFSLNGLYDDQVRFFVDGVPLDLGGFPLGIQNVPVNLLSRVEIYRGVVPVRLGADALGGAVNLVTRTSKDPHLASSYQVGSFGTHRATLDGSYLHEPTGLFVASALFLDVSKNNYSVDVKIPDVEGTLQATRVTLFHDAYRAYGGNLELGVVERPWARKLTIQLFASRFDREVQNNYVMTVPYGAVRESQTGYGTTLRYDVALRPKLDLELVANYARRNIGYVDKWHWVYNWRGERVMYKPLGGELGQAPVDQVTWQDGAFARVTASWRIAASQVLRASASPAYTTRTGHDRLRLDTTAPELLHARSGITTLVSGLEHQLNVLGDRLTNVVFVKGYFYRAEGPEQLANAILRSRARASSNVGVGDSLRYTFTRWFHLKASYEYATRLPTSNEALGDGAFVVANFQLKPEVSHNGNLGPHFELRRTVIGDVISDINLFVRQSRDLILPLGVTPRTTMYQNVYEARGLGIENALSWVSTGQWVGADATLTWQDVRNASPKGEFSNTHGDRIPNRPYFFSSWGSHVKVKNLPQLSDSLYMFYNGRYVHSFYRGWESLGIRTFKQLIDSQVTHSSGVSYTLARQRQKTTATFEVDNLTDARVFDNFGVQRPGRAFYLKLTGEI